MQNTARSKLLIASAAFVGLVEIVVCALLEPLWTKIPLNVVVLCLGVAAYDEYRRARNV